MRQLTTILLLFLIVLPSHSNAKPLDTAFQIELSSIQELETVLANQHGLDSLIIILKQASKQAKQASNKPLLAAVKLQMGISQYQQGLYRQAMGEFYEALYLYEHLADHEKLALLHNKIGTVYLQRNELLKALSHFQLAQETAKQVEGEYELITSFMNIGRTYLLQKNYDQALTLYTKALKLAKQSTSKKIIPQLLSGLGQVYDELGNSTKAIRLYQQALTLQQGNSELEVVIHAQMGLAYQKIGNTQEANRYFSQGLKQAVQFKMPYQVMDIQKSLSDFYRDQKNFKYALQHYQAYISLRDSLITSKSQKQIAELTAKYESKKKDQEIKLLKQSQKLIKQENQLQLWLYVSSSILLIISCVVGGVIIHRQRNKIKNKTQYIALQKQENHKQQVLHLSSLEHETQEKLGLAKQLNAKDQQISAHALHIIQKQQFMKEIYNKLTAISKKPTVTAIKRVMKQVDESIQSNREWEQLNQALDQLNDDFFLKLQRLNPKLTSNELRLCLLAKLNFNIKEMAAALKIMPNSVAVSRHRIRRKLNLDSEQEFNLYMINLDKVTQPLSEYSKQHIN